MEHVLGLLKHRLGWRKVRFRGLKKNAEYAYAAVACGNLYQHRGRLLKYLEGVNRRFVLAEALGLRAEVGK